MSLQVRGVLVVVIGVLLGIALSVSHAVLADKEEVEATVTSTLPWEDARLLAEVLERVKRDYVDDVDDRVLIEGAIRGMIASLDPYSSFLDPGQFEDIQVTTRGSYSGVGIEVSTRNGLLEIIAPMDDTPATAAGLLPGDVITTIDGEVVDEGNLADMIGRLRGEAGTSITLGIDRAGSDETTEYLITRARIMVSSVRSRLLEPDYAYVRIAVFSESTGKDLNRAVRRLRRTNGGALKGVVLDLRNNPGGVLDSAADVADAFLDDGLIVSGDGRVDDARFTMRASPGDVSDGAAMVVLVNAGSASASEIVAGALRDHGRATIVGNTTFGKGSVQTVMPLSDGRALKLTTSKYYTPSGESIHESGISPDIELDAATNNSAVREVGLEEAIAVLKGEYSTTLGKSAEDGVDDEDMR
ncbi:MAG: S41 family peptidase [Gammaproteobacteria bacterium]|nr:S41 family peptidase [Gammaproteobacteria bacterium]